MEATEVGRVGMTGWSVITGLESWKAMVWRSRHLTRLFQDKDLEAVLPTTTTTTTKIMNQSLI